MGRALLHPITGARWKKIRNFNFRGLLIHFLCENRDCMCGIKQKAGADGSTLSPKITSKSHYIEL